MVCIIGVQFNANQLQGGKGSGLGLWVSKGFVDRHNGTLVATSDGIGKGSTFTVSLPAYSRESDSAKPKHSPVVLLEVDLDTERKSSQHVSPSELVSTKSVPLTAVSLCPPSPGAKNTKTNSNAPSPTSFKVTCFS